CGRGGAEGPGAKAMGSALGAAVTPKLEALEKATTTKLDELSARVKHLEDQPASTQGALLALGKAADGGLNGTLAGGLAEEALQKLAQSGPQGAIEAAKLIQKMPGNAYHVGGAGVRPIAG